MVPGCQKEWHLIHEIHRLLILTLFLVVVGVSMSGDCCLPILIFPTSSRSSHDSLSRPKLAQMGRIWTPAATLTSSRDEKGSCCCLLKCYFIFCVARIFRRLVICSFKSRAGRRIVGLIGIISQDRSREREGAAHRLPSEYGEWVSMKHVCCGIAYRLHCCDCLLVIVNSS